MLLTWFWEVPDSTPDTYIDYPVSDILWFFTVLLGECKDRLNLNLYNFTERDNSIITFNAEEPLKVIQRR
jgi:hypothetical protein